MNNTKTNKTLVAYQDSPTLSKWLESNQPGDNMLWRSSAKHQAEWMVNLASFGLCGEPRAIAVHRSKSIDLPVPAALIGNPEGNWAILMLRDNFYDVNVAVSANCPLTLDYGLLSVEMSAAEYQTEKKRAYDYMGVKGVTEAQWEDGSWYEEWSGGSLVCEDNKIWIVRRAFAEGISHVPGVSGEPYTHGCNSFTSVLPSHNNDVLVAFGALVDAVKACL
jgi:hypothetical protein